MEASERHAATLKLASEERRRRPKMAELVAERIELQIVEQGWPVGKIVGSEADLLAEHACSRAVLREAIRLLEHHNVARMRRGPGGGLVVTEPDVVAVTRASGLYLEYAGVDLDDLTEARIGVEAAAIRLAIDHLDDDAIARLRATLEEEATFTSEVDHHYHRLHFVIADLSANPAIRLFVEVLARLTNARGAITTDLRAARPSTPEAPVLAHEEHARVVDEIVARDVEGAIEAMRAHLISVRDNTLSQEAVEADGATSARR